jgi:FkbM family methyltransferase
VESEEPVQQHLTELFGRITPECVLDVGANTGQYGRMLREHGYQGWIVSFEPVRAAFDELAATAELDGRWRAFQLALGSKAEHRRIAVAEVSQLSSFRSFSEYGAAEFPGASEVISEEEVELRTLDDSWREFLDGIPSGRLFLKLDTQGWDLEVLEGATKLLTRLVGLQLEASITPIYEHVPTFSQVVDHVTSLGFGLTAVFPVNRDSRFRLIEVDCVFVNPELIEAEETWAMLEHRLAQDVARAVPTGADFLLIDEGVLGLDQIEGRRAIPFLDYGQPEDGDAAVAELRGLGARHLVIAWPSFWWLDEYAELAEQLRTKWRRVADTDAAIVFELADSGDAEQLS